MEYTIRDILEQNYGTVNEPVDSVVKQERLQLALESFEKTSIAFKENPSATNWNMLITVMTNYQYWERKSVISDERV